MPRMQPLKLSAVDVPFVDLIIAFLQQVLHIPEPGCLAIRSLNISTDTYEWISMRRLIPVEYAVTIVLDAPLPSIGDTLFLTVIDRAGNYAISKLYFEPGWKPAKEQE
jgi:hypothetical protein